MVQLLSNASASYGIVDFKEHLYPTPVEQEAPPAEASGGDTQVETPTQAPVVPANGTGQQARAQA